MKLCFPKLLILTLIQGRICAIFSNSDNEKKNIAVIYSSDNTDAEFPDNITNTVKAYLPSHVNDVNVKNRRALQKRSAGREVHIPKEVVESMANTPISALSTDLPAIQKIILDTHNKYRCKADPPATNMLKLIWSSEAAKLAKAWAQKCPKGHSPQDSRKIPNFRCGESIYLSEFKVPWDVVVDAWHSEIIDFIYGSDDPPKNENGHFTQLMWATSYLIGCAVAECRNYQISYAYVCLYCPAGNKGSRKCPWKEGKPCKDCPNSCENNLCTNPCPYEDIYKNCADYKSNCPIDPSMPKEKCSATCQCTKGEIK